MTPNPRLAWLSVGRPQIVLNAGRPYSTAINRRIVDTPLMLTTDGLDGDQVSNRKDHGGPDKAVCVFPHEHYAYFAGRLGVELAVPAFGENFTTTGLDERDVCIGDVFEIGGAVVQISQPRQPCWKLAHKHRQPQLLDWVNEKRWTGFYLRVLRPGEVQVGLEWTRRDRPCPDLTVAAATAAMLDRSPNPELWRRLERLDVLSHSWRDHFARRLAGGDDGDEA